MLYFLSGRGTSLQNCVFKVTRKRSEKSQVFLRQNCLGLKIYAWKRTRNKKVKKKRYCKSFGGKFSWLKILQFHKGPKKSQKKNSKSFGGKMFVGWRHCAFKKGPKKSKKTLSLLAGKFFLVEDIALLKGTKTSRKKTCLFAGKLSLEKKSLRFWMVSCFESKIY